MNIHPQIEHPNSIGIVNKRVLDGVSAAYSVALDLAAKGFIVKGIHSSSDQPRIELHANNLCRVLDSGVKKQGRDRKGPYQVRAACIDGCEVNWTVRRNP